MRSIICPHCGKPDWSSAPTYSKVYHALKELGPSTAREVADKIVNISIINTINTLKHLLKLELVTKEPVKPMIWRVNENR